MKKIISLLVFMSILGFVYSSNDPASTKIMTKKVLTETVFQLEEESYVNDIPFDTKEVFLNHYLDKISHNKDSVNEKLTYIDNRNFNGHWSGFDIGVNGFMNNDFNMNLPKEYDYLDLKLGKSINIHFNFLEKNINLIKNKFGLVTGLGLEYKNYRFDNNVVLIEKDNDISHEYKNYDKNKLVINYLNIPLFLEYQTNNKSNSNSFHVGCGVVGGVKIGSHTKMLTKENGRDKDKNKDDFYLNKFKLESMVRMGWNKIDLYANYSFIPLFQKNKGLELYPFSVGITLVSF